MAKKLQNASKSEILRFNLSVFAEAYNKYLVPYMFQPTSRELFRHLTFKDKKVLDVGCGTGAVTWEMVPLVGSGGQVIGIDPNEAMLEIATKNPFQLTLKDGQPPKWMNSFAEQLPVSNQSIDIVTCQHVIQFCKDYDQVFKEFRRVLKAGGKLALTVWVPDVNRHLYFKKLQEVYLDLGLTYALDGLQQPLSFNGDLKLLKSLAESNHFEINQLYEKSHIVHFPNYQNAFQPFLAQEKLKQSDNLKEYEKFKENLEKTAAKIFSPILERDGKAFSPVMPAYVLIATRKSDSRL